MDKFLDVVLAALSWAMNTFSRSTDPFLNEARRRERLWAEWFIAALIFAFLGLFAAPTPMPSPALSVAHVFAEKVSQGAILLSGLSALIGLFWAIRRLTFVKEVDAGWWTPRDFES